MDLRIKIFILFVFIFLGISCSTGTVNDYSTLKQKALEIPPDFELTPPVEGQDETVAEVESVSSETSDIEELIKGSDSESPVSEEDQSTDIDSDLNQFIEDQFLTEDDQTPDEIVQDELIEENALTGLEVEEILNEDQTNTTESVEETSEDDSTITDEEFTEAVEEILNEDVEDDAVATEDQFTEEDFLEGLSDTEEIISLPEEEQLAPMILDDIPYEDNTGYGLDEDLDDLLDRVDDLLSDY